MDTIDAWTANNCCNRGRKDDLRGKLRAGTGRWRPCCALCLSVLGGRWGRAAVWRAPDTTLGEVLIVCFPREGQLAVISLRCVSAPAL